MSINSLGFADFQSFSPSLLEEEAIALAGLYFNKLIDNYPEFMARIDTMLRKMGPSPARKDLEIIYEQLRNIDPPQVMGETLLVLASYNQFNIPGSVGDLGRTACSTMAGEALYRALTEGIINPASIDNILIQGMHGYLSALANLNARPSSLIGQLKPGAYLAWGGEASRLFEKCLRPVGQGTLQAEISLLAPKDTYLSLLKELASRSPNTSIGAVIHTSGGVFLSVVIHYDEQGQPVVFIFDSHGHRALTQSRNAPAYFAKSSSLDSAARLLALLYPSVPNREQDNNIATFYPLQSLAPAISPISFSANSPSWKEKAISNMKGDPIGMNFIELLDNAEQSLRDRLVSTGKSDLHALLITVSERSIFPFLLKASPDKQKLLINTFDGWMQHLLPVFPISTDKSTSRESGELLIQIIHASARFLTDYKAAAKANAQSWIGRSISPLSHEEMDQKIASQLMGKGQSKRQILECLVREMAIHAGLEAAQPFCESAAKLLEQMIDGFLHSSLPATLLQNLLEDEQLTEGLSEIESSSSMGEIYCAHSSCVNLDSARQSKIDSEASDRRSPAPSGQGEEEDRFGEVVASPNSHNLSGRSIPSELLDALLKMAHGLIDLGNPDISMRFIKFLTLRNSIVRVIARAISLFPLETKKELDIGSFALHLLRKYSLQEDPSHRLAPEELAQKLSSHLLEMAVHGQISSKVAKKTIAAFKNYSPVLNLPRTIDEMGKQIFLLLQRPEAMSAFIYEYLLNQALLPKLAEQNVAKAKKQVLEPVHAIFTQIGEETSLFLARFLKDYVFPSIVRNSSLSQSGLGVMEQAILAYLPNAMAKALSGEIDPSTQHFYCNIFESISHFWGDFVIARQSVTRSLPGGRDAYTKRERSEAIFNSINQARKSRGAPLLKKEDKQKKLASLSNYILKESALTEQQKAALEQILPSLFETMISQLSSPLLHQILLLLLTPHQRFEMAGSSGLSNPWEPEMVERWNKCMLNILQTSVQLSGIDNVALATIIPILQKMLDKGGRQIAFLGSTPSLFFDPSGQLNLIRLLEASLWKEGEPTLSLESFLNLTPTQKEELRTKAIEGFRSQFSLLEKVLKIPFISQLTSPAEEVASHFIDTFCELIEDPNLLEMLIYQYVIEEISPAKPDDLLNGEFIRNSMKILVDPALVDRILVDIRKENPTFTEEECLCRAVEMAIRRTIGQRDTVRDQFLSDTLTSLNKAKSPLTFLSSFLSAMRQVNYWQNCIETIHQSKDESSIFSFYQAFTETAPHLFSFPFTPRQQAILASQLQAPLKAASWKDAGQIPTDWTGPIDIHVCKDSMEGIQQKLNLLKKAKHCVALSGSYFGGTPLTQALLILRDKMRENSHFKVYMLGSEYMLKSENHQLLKALQKTYPHQFHLVLNHEVNPFTNPQTGSFFLMCNHVKLLVIDEGTDFLIGGSGIEDRWANHDGIHPIEAHNRDTKEPLAFRDTDYIFHSTSPNGLGRLLHYKLLELCAHCNYMKDEELAKRYFDPRFYPLSSISQTTDSQPVQSQKRIEFFATNPEEAVGNGYEQRLIELIEMAQNRIVIDHMYFHPSDALLQSLIRASNRGVSIILVTNKDQSDAPGTHKLFVPRSRYLWKKLFEGRAKDNIVVFEFQVPYTTLHKKVILIDDCVATGSSNCSLLSMQGLNHEYNVIIHSPEVASQTMDAIEADIEVSIPVTEDDATQTSWAEQVASVATTPLQYFF